MLENGAHSDSKSTPAQAPTELLLLKLTFIETGDRKLSDERSRERALLQRLEIMHDAPSFDKDWNKNVRRIFISQDRKMTDKPKYSATETPYETPISLMATQARPSNRVIRSTLLKALETDPTTVGRSEVEHDRADRFKLERLALPDGTPTSYLLCRHFACEERPFKDKVFLGIGKSGKVTNSQVKNHMEIGYHGGTMEQLSEAAAEVCISLRLPPTLFSSDSFKKLTEFLSDGYFPGGINEEDIRGHFEQKGYDPEWESEEEMN